MRAKKESTLRFNINRSESYPNPLFIDGTELTLGRIDSGSGTKKVRGTRLTAYSQPSRRVQYERIPLQLIF